MYIIWKWRSINEQESDHVDSSSVEEFDVNSDAEEDNDASATHSIIFKCIGSTKDAKYQETLKTVRDQIILGLSIPVTLVHEPNNIRDSRALAFVCHMQNVDNTSSECQTIGYIITELLDEVHAAIKKKEIVSVTISWVRYITDWKIGPGFFAGIAIKKKGRWSPLAIKLASYKI